MLVECHLSRPIDFLGRGRNYVIVLKVGLLGFCHFDPLAGFFVPQTLSRRLSYFTFTLPRRQLITFGRATRYKSQRRQRKDRHSKERRQTNPQSHHLQVQEENHSPWPPPSPKTPPPNLSSRTASRPQANTTRITPSSLLLRNFPRRFLARRCGKQKTTATTRSDGRMFLVRRRLRSWEGRRMSLLAAGSH